VLVQRVASINVSPLTRSNAQTHRLSGIEKNGPHHRRDHCKNTNETYVKNALDAGSISARAELLEFWKG